jgi:FMN reductase
MRTETTDPSLRIVGICGSLRQGSYTRLALEVALRGAEEVGARTQLLDLRDYDLPMCDGRRDHSSYPEGIFRLRKEVQSAQGIILGTPVYHGSFSGVLKNTLDLMGFREFEGKMIGLVGVSGGRIGAVGALSTLRTIGRTLHAWVIPSPKLGRPLMPAGIRPTPSLRRGWQTWGGKWPALPTCILLNMRWISSKCGRARP